MRGGYVTDSKHQTLNLPSKDRRSRPYLVLLLFDALVFLLPTGLSGTGSGLQLSRTAEQNARMSEV